MLVAGLGCREATERATPSMFTVNGCFPMSDMSAHAILLNFRMALQAIVPFVEQVGIKWKRPDAYDEWDAIASTLFEEIVVKAVMWSLPEDEQKEFQLPRCDLLLSSYGASNWIQVTHPSLQEAHWIFHAFGTQSEPFDVAEIRRVTAGGKPLSDGFESCPVQGATFSLHRREQK